MSRVDDCICAFVLVNCNHCDSVITIVSGAIVAGSGMARISREYWRRHPTERLIVAAWW
jgi:hypothetical protein